MEEFYPEIESLKPAIEAKIGKRLVTPADFTDLIGAIEHDTGVHVGITTVNWVGSPTDTVSCAMTAADASP